MRPADELAQLRGRIRRLQVAQFWLAGISLTALAAVAGTVGPGVLIQWPLSLITAGTLSAYAVLAINELKLLPRLMELDEDRYEYDEDDD